MRTDKQKLQLRLKETVQVIIEAPQYKINMDDVEGRDNLRLEAKKDADNATQVIDKLASLFIGLGLTKDEVGSTITTVILAHGLSSLADMSGEMEHGF